MRTFYNMPDHVGHFGNRRRHRRGVKTAVYADTLLNPSHQQGAAIDLTLPCNQQVELTEVCSLEENGSVTLSANDNMHEAISANRACDSNSSNGSLAGNEMERSIDTVSIIW